MYYRENVFFFSPVKSSPRFLIGSPSSRRPENLTGNPDLAADHGKHRRLLLFDDTARAIYTVRARRLMCIARARVSCCFKIHTYNARRRNAVENIKRRLCGSEPPSVTRSPPGLYSWPLFRRRIISVCVVGADAAGTVIKYNNYNTSLYGGEQTARKTGHNDMQKTYTYTHTRVNRKRAYGVNVYCRRSCTRRTWMKFELFTQYTFQILMSARRGSY